MYKIIGKFRTQLLRFISLCWLQRT